MVDVSTVALSGFNASEARLQVAANNIANANTSNFRAGAVAQSTNRDGSVSTRVVAANPAPQPAVQQSISQSTQAGQSTQRAQSQQQDTNDVDITTDLVNTNFATYSAQADLKVLKTQDQLNKYLVDLQA